MSSLNLFNLLDITTLDESFKTLQLFLETTLKRKFNDDDSKMNEYIELIVKKIKRGKV